MPNTPLKLLLFLSLALPLGLSSSSAQAFCGFYVSGANSKMYNDATMVVMMREGTQTILSMRNSYQGPPQDFAMVVPVPVVLKKDQVKTLDDDLFRRIDQLASPRLVEYWEQDPCLTRHNFQGDEISSLTSGLDAEGGKGRSSSKAVRIEAQFKVAEYDIVILSATESTGLETWLKQNKYNIPKGAAAAMKPYIAQGQYFFVAKVDPQKVVFSKDNRAMLSPLRFHYNAKQFSLPIRLGLLNAKGQQDLLIHILAKNQRYDVANAINASIPTNLIVKPSTKASFAAFYDNIIDATLKNWPKSVITEYSWNARSCDPCPTPGLTQAELLSLGADTLQNSNNASWTLTRLHARYKKGEVSEDFIFRKADPLVGGLGAPVGRGTRAKMTYTTRTQTSSGINSFQGRYIILNPWTKKTTCKRPRFGFWGAPPKPPSTLQQHKTVGLKKRVKASNYIVRDAPPYLKRRTRKKSK